jgi:cobalt-zinc-cadmium efflux system protein
VNHGHEHDHGTAAFGHRGRLTIVLVITVGILVSEVIGGLLAHSLVLLADAAHMAADAGGIGLALVAVWFANRPPTPARSFGYQRAEIIAAIVNAVALLSVAVFILVEAVHRLRAPNDTTPGIMVVFGLVAIAGNGASLLLLRQAHTESLNMRGAYLEVLSDFLGAGAVLGAAAVIAATGFDRADAIASILVALLIVPRTVRLIGEALDVLLEATPRAIDIAEVRRHLTETPGVVDVHDLHVWMITSGLPVLSAHIVTEDHVLAGGLGGQVLDRLGDCLGDHFDIEHCTFQLEPAGHAAHERGGRHP